MVLCSDFITKSCHFRGTPQFALWGFFFPHYTHFYLRVIQPLEALTEICLYCIFLKNFSNKVVKVMGLQIKQKRKVWGDMRPAPVPCCVDKYENMNRTKQNNIIKKDVLLHMFLLTLAYLYDCQIYWFHYRMKCVPMLKHLNHDEGTLPPIIIFILFNTNRHKRKSFLPFLSIPDMK